MNLKIDLRLRSSVIFLLPAIINILFVSGCSSHSARQQSDEQFFQFDVFPLKIDFDGKERENIKILEIDSDQNGRLLVLYENFGHARFVKVSADGGRTFGKESLVPEFLGDSEIKLCGSGFMAILSRDRNIYLSTADSEFENWTNFSQINDEQGSYSGRLGILCRSENELFAVWLDARRGFPLTFFSASSDGGKTWSVNRPIDHDFRDGKQDFPILVFGSDGRLLSFWQDWRDRKTLVDIRYSYSNDDGANWTESRKVNDDESEVWQFFPTVVSHGSDVYVAFGDFREKGEGGDNDWNIYFAHSSDNGLTWEKNKRLNDQQRGRDETPTLSVDRDGNVYCVWRTSRNSLFGQIALSYSTDRGKSWSASKLMSEKEKMIAEGSKISLVSVSGERLISGWLLADHVSTSQSYSFFEKTDKPIESELKNDDSNKIEEQKLSGFEHGKQLFFDDFSDEKLAKWKPETGIWSVVDGSYMGVHPHNNNSSSFVSYANFEEPERYVLSGRFKLDPVAHTAASIYFRTSRSNLRHLVITNRFRFGTWLSIKNDDRPNGLHISGGKPLIQKRFPFRNDQWYQFRLNVSPKRVEYFVDGRLMLVATDGLTLPKGKIGLGGFYSSPAYFDDISVSALKE